ncbi:hypothetical protein DEIPH_ctg026orf0046 [Deinococcus phoenicis]|uniref:Lipopolysaccharide biosynthesis protein n=1 Tax=Deinococcus phoenicis TaxID=1476583 RepID=A0A016QQ04_9DEIO|nr:hypothetical protein DEIPH_ctg026orf0046 [Deinococcus phoenicis]
MSVQRFLGALVRHAPFIAACGVVMGAASYFVSARQPPVYEATSSVVTVQPGNGNSLLSATLITAPPLPAGAVEGALHSEGLVNDITARLRRAPLGRQEAQTLAAALHGELARGHFGRVTVRANLNPQGNGVYEITASAETPLAAQTLANASVSALLRWDTGRAVQSVQRARTALDRQVASLTRRIRTSGDALVTRTLEDARNDAVGQVAQLEELGQAASGSLALLSRAVLPSTPAAPTPVRSALLAFLAAAFLATLAAFGWEAAREQRQGTASRRGGVPVLGRLPRRTRGEAHSLLDQAVPGAGASAHDLGLLRVNLRVHLMNTPQVVVTRTSSGTGTSAVTALLARSLADEGQRVLIVDARRDPADQPDPWATQPVNDPPKGERPHSGTAHDLSPTAPGIDLLRPEHPPAGPGVRLSPERLADLRRAYDIVLIDAAPMTEYADALLFAARAGVLVLVTAEGRTGQAELGEALGLARTAGVQVAGLVLTPGTGKGATRFPAARRAVGPSHRTSPAKRKGSEVT